MHAIHRSTPFVRALLGACALALLIAATALGHTQTVTPNGNGEGFTKPISNPWAQAHCHGAAVGIVGEASNGVMQFLPAESLPCPDIENPGGQVHP